MPQRPMRPRTVSRRRRLHPRAVVAAGVEQAVAGGAGVVDDPFEDGRRVGIFQQWDAGRVVHAGSVRAACRSLGCDERRRARSQRPDGRPWTFGLVPDWPPPSNPRAPSPVAQGLRQARRVSYDVVAAAAPVPSVVRSPPFDLLAAGSRPVSASSRLRSTTRSVASTSLCSMPCS